jgi:hypothetical protein
MTNQGNCEGVAGIGSSIPLLGISSARMHTAIVGGNYSIPIGEMNPLHQQMFGYPIRIHTGWFFSFVGCGGGERARVVRGQEFPVDL